MLKNRPFWQGACVEDGMRRANLCYIRELKLKLVAQVRCRWLLNAQGNEEKIYVGKSEVAEYCTGEWRTFVA